MRTWIMKISFRDAQLEVVGGRGWGGKKRQEMRVASFLLAETVTCEVRLKSPTSI